MLLSTLFADALAPGGLQVIFHGGLIDVFVMLVSLTLVLLLLGRRFLRMMRPCAVFTVTDLVLMLVVVALPILHALCFLPVQWLVWMGGGVDADQPFVWGVRRVHIYAFWTMAALLIVLMAGLVQRVVRRFRFPEYRGV